jgi:L-2-hydroxyglutarate oxidase
VENLLALILAGNFARVAPRCSVLEKEARTAAHQSGRNSGVLHSGLYYRPGSLRARNCAAGRTALVAYARRHGIRHDVCGKLVVAVSAGELAELQRLHANGLANGLTDVEVVNPAGIHKIEPFCAGVAALWVPYSGSIDFPAVAASFAEQLLSRRTDNRVQLETTVHTMQTTASGVRLATSRGEVQARFVISCAGLQADRVARLGSRRPANGLVTFRGDFFRLRQRARHLVRSLIYPVPDPAMPFLGIHMTRTVDDDDMECGPSAVPTFKREGYRKADFSLRETAAALGYPGNWRLMRDMPRSVSTSTAEPYPNALFSDVPAA